MHSTKTYGQDSIIRYRNLKAIVDVSCIECLLVYLFISCCSTYFIGRNFTLEAVKTVSYFNSRIIKMMMNADWVNFELGTDVRDEHRLIQDQQWADAIADGRSHLSHREMAMLNAPQLSLAISDYKFIDELVNACLSMDDSNRSILKKITTDVLRVIIEYAYPDHGCLVTSSTIRRELTTIISTERSYTSVSDSSSLLQLQVAQHPPTFPFRVCIRKRPMLPYESNFGAYDVATVDNETGITLHEGKLARNGTIRCRMRRTTG